MRINWEELPDILSFCNGLNAFVFFNTVYYPPHLALWNTPPEKLKLIHETLSSKKKSGGGITAKKNKEHFQDFLNQVDSWHKKALQNEKISQEYEIMDIKQVGNRLIENLSNFMVGENINKETNEELMNKYNQIMGQIDSDKTKMNLFKTLDAMPVETFFDLLNDNSPETLLSMLAQYTGDGSSNERNFVFKYDS